MRTILASAVLLAAMPLAGCNDSVFGDTGTPDLSQSGTAPGTHRQYGTPLKVGDGQARAYVVLDAKRGNAPLEIGVALSERAMEGLPAPMPHGGGGAGGHAHVDTHEFLLPLPAQNPTPFKLVEMNWNPAGHEPPGIYDIPHFDFHFYTISKAERDAIVPSDPAFATKAANFPQAAYVPAGFMVLPPPPAPVSAVPVMGVHWSDLSAPELQGALGKPDAYRPFTKTFIYGSWDGRFTFWEPMITRAYLLTKPDVTVPISIPARVAAPGYYPAAYRVTYDAKAKEYRIALTQLAQRN
jgi:hypothetical protein